MKFLSFIFSRSRAFCLFVFCVLFSLNCLADSKYYGKWYCEGGNDTERCVTLCYVNTANKQHDVVNTHRIDCYGYLTFAEYMDEPLVTYLISECEETSDGVRIAVFSEDEEIPTGSYVTLKYEDGNMVIKNEDGEEGSIGKLLDGLTLTQSQTASELVKSDEVFSGDIVEDSEPSAAVSSNEEAVPQDTISQAAATDGEGESYWGSERMKNDLIGLGIFIVYIGMIIHMIYELFIKKRPYKKTGYTAEEMKQARAASGKPEEITPEEGNEIDAAINDAYAGWIDGGDGMIYPIKHQHIKNAENALVRIAAIQPTNQEDIDHMNNLVEVLEGCKKRIFNGSKKLIILTVIIAGLLTWITGTYQMIPFFVVSLLIYYFASLTPTWMFNKPMLEGKTGNHTSTAILAGILAFIGSARTYRTVTKWDDGTTTVDDDRSEHGLFLAIGIILLIMLAVFIAVWAVFNYVRNYIIYK